MAPEQVRGDERAVRGIMEQYVACWNKADAKGLAGLYADKAEFISSLGIRAQGRPAIEKFYEDTLVKGVFKGTTNDCTVESVSFPTDNVALIKCNWRILEANKQVQRGGYMQGVVVREGGRWLFHAFQATAAEAVAKARAAA